MQVIEALLVSRYVRLLKANHKSVDEVTNLKKEFIDYLEGEKNDNLSNELTEFLVFLKENEQYTPGSKGRIK